MMLLSPLGPCPMRLQWVHGPRTVVMSRRPSQCASGRTSFNGSTVREPWLCAVLTIAKVYGEVASMGPRSENRGYGVLLRLPVGLGQSASMGPRSENRGYEKREFQLVEDKEGLQWVHGPRTVVMDALRMDGVKREECFNGSTVREPWLCVQLQSRVRRRCGFNGSTVREPWLC